MSYYPTDLCVLLVQDAYGELASRIYESLLRHGRTTITALQHITRLSLRQIKHGLAALVQQNLIFWCQGDDDQANFEANVSTAYSLLRTGKYVKITESRAGGYAGAIMSRLLLLGHVRVGEFIQTLSSSYNTDMNGHSATGSALPGDTIPPKTHMNGETNGDGPLIREKIKATLCELLHCGLITPVHEHSLRSDADNRMEADGIATRSRYDRIKSEKAKKQMQEAQARTLLHEWKFGTRKERIEMKALGTVHKRPLEDLEELPAKKRQRLDINESSHADHSGGEGSSQLTVNSRLKDELVVRVNHNRFMVMMRNEHMVDMAEKAIGTVTSHVFQKVLRKLETNMLACQEDSYEGEGDDDEDILNDPPTVTTQELAASLNDDPNYADALGKVDHRIGEDVSFHPKNRRRKTNGYYMKRAANGDHGPVDDESLDLSEDESDEVANITFGGDSDDDMDDDFYDLNGDHTEHHLIIRQHLLLLADHPDHFVTHIHATPIQPEKWAVDFRALRRTAILKVIFHTIDTRLGTLSTRLARICQEYGRMDDKSLQSKSLLAQKEMRARLLDMQNRGLLQLQEVPRDNSRLASRTTFLYYMDEGKTAAKIRDECYQTITRCIQRLYFEREKVAGVLEKAERSDVKGREDELLGAKEKEALGRWKAKEEMFWGEIGRVDDIVGVLRDF